jgi:hypothetical protein
MSWSNLSIVRSLLISTITDPIVGYLENGTAAGAAILLRNPRPTSKVPGNSRSDMGLRRSVLITLSGEWRLTSAFDLGSWPQVFWEVEPDAFRGWIVPRLSWQSTFFQNIFSTPSSTYHH